MINGNRITIRSVFQYPATFVFLDLTSQLKDEKSEKKWKHILYIYKKINNSVVTREYKFKIMVKRNDIFERNKVSVIGC